MRRLALAAAAAAALAGCGNDRTGSGSEPFLAVGRVLGDQFRALRGGGTPVTRATVAGFPDPLLHARIPARGAEGLLGVIARRDDVVTWATPDGITLTLKGGVLAATRGLGDDLMSAEVPAIAGLAARGPGPWQVLRRHYRISGDERSRREDYRCTVAAAGPETIEVLERRHATLHLTETCAAAAAPGQTVFVNDYWLEPDGTMRRSRQWAGAGIGHVELQRVVD